MKSGETIIYKHLMVFSDGGARGNPGPAAIAFIIQSETGQTVTSNSRYVGVCTNNQAEYQALLAALETAATLKTETVTCHLDSELVVKQVSGEYRVKKQELRQLWQEVQEKKKQFTEVKFVNVPRSHRVIQEVDKLVNMTLDAKQSNVAS
jgi:ribonuclease HI